MAIEYRALSEQQSPLQGGLRPPTGGMKMKVVRTLLVLLAATLAASTAHARGAPIQNFEDLPIESGDGKPLSTEQVKNAIISGGARSRWTASVQPGNVVRLTYSRRSHGAVVDVAYTAKTYSIRY